MLSRRLRALQLISSAVRFPSHNTAPREVLTGRRRHTTLSPSSPSTMEDLYAKLIEEKDKAMLEKDKAMLEKDKLLARLLDRGQ